MLFASPRGILLNLDRVFKKKRRGWEKGRALSCYCTPWIHKVDPWTIFGWLSWVCWICTFRLRARALLFSVALLKPRSLSWSASRPEPRATAQASLTLLSSFFFSPPLLLVHATMTLLSREGLTHCHVSCLWHRLAMSLFHFRSICCLERGMSVSRHLWNTHHHFILPHRVNSLS